MRTNRETTGEGFHGRIFGDHSQLIKAGLVCGKTVPATVAAHPCVFLTATAPSFGPVHSTRAGRDGRARPCRPRRLAETCPHGRALRCHLRHQDGDPLLGQPFCLDCYDHAGQVVWNACVTELWRRSLIKVNLGVPAKTLYQWRYTGYGPAAKRVGKYLRYKPDDVIAWFEALDGGAHGRP